MLRVAATGEDVLLTVLDAGAEDAVEEDDGITIYTDQKDLAKVREALLAAGLKVDDAELQYVGTTEVAVADEETESKVMKLLDALDDLDDVVNVHTNANLGE